MLDARSDGGFDGAMAANDGVREGIGENDHTAWWWWWW
jgi:hypothetical protein